MNQSKLPGEVLGTVEGVGRALKVRQLCFFPGGGGCWVNRTLSVTILC
jgi:hypothetical protein